MVGVISEMKKGGALDSQIRSPRYYSELFCPWHATCSGSFLWYITYANQNVHAVCWNKCFTLESTIFNTRSNILISLKERVFIHDKTK